MKLTAKNIYRSLMPTKLRYLFFSLRRLSIDQDIPHEITKLKQELLYFKIAHHFQHNDSTNYRDEVEYLNKLGRLTPFPYKSTAKKIDEVETGYDEEKKLPFVLHKGKRLYFPEHYSLDLAKNNYLNLIVTENLLEGGYSDKAPHQYETDSFFVKEGDTLLDIGASEGLFMLNSIDKIKKGFLFEPDKAWLCALNATFEPYKEKVEIVNKLASDKDSTREMTIDTCLKNDLGNIFIKIDVEGSEYSVLTGANSVLGRGGDIRVACCTYHRQNDADLFERFFKNLNYNTEFSEGYMLFHFDETIKPPYFRKGLIRARKI